MIRISWKEFFCYENHDKCYVKCEKSFRFTPLEVLLLWRATEMSPPRQNED